MTKEDAMEDPTTLERAKEIIANLRDYVSELGRLLEYAHDDQVRYIYDGQSNWAWERHAKHRPDCPVCRVAADLGEWGLR